MKHVHLFGAYFGLAVSSRFAEPSPRSEKNASTPKSDLLSMLGKTFGLMPQTEEESESGPRKWQCVRDCSESKKEVLGNRPWHTEAFAFKVQV